MPAMSHFFQLKHTIVIISVASWQRSSMARHILPAPQTTDTVALSVLYDSNETLQQVLILAVAFSRSCTTCKKPVKIVDTLLVPNVHITMTLLADKKGPGSL